MKPLLKPWQLMLLILAGWIAREELSISTPFSVGTAGEARRLTSGTALESQPSAAPRTGGGRRVVFASTTENSDVWSLPIAAEQARRLGNPQRLTDNAAADLSPDISVDGKKLIFVSTRTGSEQMGQGPRDG